MIPSDGDDCDPQESSFADLAEAFDEAIASGDTANDAADPTLPPQVATRLHDMQKCLLALNEACRQGLIGPTVESSNRAPASDDLPRPEDFRAPSVEGAFVGRFEILRELGRGGYGVVYLASDHVLNRLVAIKMPRPELLGISELRNRFLREAQVAGGLDHPHLVPVFEVGEDGPLCYIAAAYCAGPTLAEWLKQRGQVTAHEAATIVAQVADGLAHAHERGVLHRDIKPSNVLLDLKLPAVTLRPPDGPAALKDYIPRLTDFGLAKLLESAEDRTLTGTLLGTTCYMAPEQAEGRVRDIDARTDVYGLGVLLYELLTGRPPFRGESDADTLRQISLGNLVVPGQLRSGLSRDLEAICVKCLETESARRFSSAAAVADDLRRFLAGQPTVARPANSLERAWKWIRRRPAQASLIAVSIVSALVITLGSLAAYQQIRWAFQEQAKSQQSERRVAYTQLVKNAWQSWTDGNVQGACRQLDMCRPEPGQEDLREFAWRLLGDLTHQELQALHAPPQSIYRVAFTPDQQHLIAAGEDSVVRSWGVADGLLECELTGHAGEINDLAVAPDGDILATASDDGTARIWNLKSRQCMNVLNGHDRQRVTTVSFAPGDSTLVTGGRDGRIVFWDWEKGTVYQSVAAHEKGVSQLSYSPAGDILVSTGADQTLKVWEVESTKLLKELPLSGDVALTAMAFSRDGKHLVTAAKADCRLWDAKLWLESKGLYTAMDPVYGLTFCHDDRSIAVASKDGRVVLIDVDAGEERERFNGHFGVARCVSLSPDGQILATGGSDGTVKLWGATGRGPQTLQDLRRRVTTLAWSHDGWLAAGTDDPLRISVRRDETSHTLRYDTPPLAISGDFDGDGQTDSGTYHEGHWQIELAGERNSTFESADFGDESDIPVIGDWNGDGRDDLGTFCNGKWTLKAEFNDTHQPMKTVEFGTEDHIPIVGDWNGDGRDDLGLFADGLFELRNLTSQSEPLTTLVLGGASAVPIVGDWDSDRRDDVAVLEGTELLIDVGLTGRPAEYRVSIPPSGEKYIPRLIAKPATLDDSFGDAGLSILSQLGPAEATAVIVDPDGKVIVTGCTAVGAQYERAATGIVARFLTDGQIDRTFGTQQQGLTELPHEDMTSPNDLLRQPDGKLLVLSEGTRQGAESRSITRFLDDGRIDTSFGGAGDGQAFVSFGEGSLRAASMALQPDGKIVVVGCFQRPKDEYGDSAIARFTSNGLPDQNFGASNGQIIVPVSPFRDLATCVAIDSMNRLVVGGYAWDASNCSAVLLRMHEDGSLDPGFGRLGKMMARPSHVHVTDFFGVLVTETGDIVACGVAAGRFQSGAVARFKSGGNPDVSFGSQQWIVVPQSPEFARFLRLAIDGSGSIWAAGQAGYGPSARIAAIRLGKDGSYDSEFTLNLPDEDKQGTSSRAWDIAIDDKGRPVIVGALAKKGVPAFAVLRLRADPQTSNEDDRPTSSSRTWSDLDRMRASLSSALIASAVDRAAAVRTRSRVTAVALSPTGEYLASCNDNHGIVHLWRLADQRRLAGLVADAQDARAVAFSPDGTLLATAGKAGVVKLWQVGSWTELANIRDTSDPCRSLAFSPNGRILASSSDSRVALIDISSRQVVHILDHQDVNSIAFYDDGNSVLTAGDDRLIKVWETHTGEMQTTLSGHTGRVTRIDVCPAGRTLASVADDWTVRFWDLQTCQELAILPKLFRCPCSLAFSDDGQCLAVGGDNTNERGAIRRFSINAGSQKK